MAAPRHNVSFPDSPAQRPRPATPSVTGKVVLQSSACADLWHRDRAGGACTEPSAKRCNDRWVLRTSLIAGTDAVLAGAGALVGQRVPERAFGPLATASESLSVD